MTPILTLFTDPIYLKPFTQLSGWVAWFFLIALLVFGGFRWRSFQRIGKARGWLVLLFTFLVPLTNLFLGMRLTTGSALPEPGIPLGPHNPALMFFSALPWMLAGGFLGSLEGLLIGLLTGLVRGLWDTHNIFSILEPALLAVLFSLAVRQRFRTPLFHLLRQPLLVGLILVPVQAALFLYSAFFSVSDSIPARLDFALSNVSPAALAALGQMVIAGLFVQVIAMALPHSWGGQTALQPSPGERSLQFRFLSLLSTFIVLLIVLLTLGNWIVAGEAARRMIRNQLAGSAQAAVEGLPFFLETGQNIALQLAAEPRLLSESRRVLASTLDEQIRRVPYFDQLFVLDLQGGMLAMYPTLSPEEFALHPQELAGISLAVQGVTAQSYPIPPAAQGSSARLAFIVPILDEDGKPERILLGRTELALNPLTQGLINTLRGMSAMEGEGYLLDDQGTILFSTDPQNLMTLYAGERGQQTLFYELPAPTGTRNLVYYQPTMGRAWSVVLIVPARQAQQLALDIAAPLTLLVLVLALATLIFLRLALRRLTASLQSLAVDAGRISQGQLSDPLHLPEDPGIGSGGDEVGQLGLAFEQMRSSLHARMEELNQLLLVSQGVASTLDLESAVQPILEAVLATGASAVRIVLDEATTGEGPRQCFSLGPKREAFAALDEQVLAAVESKGHLVLDASALGQTLTIPPDMPAPACLLAVAMVHERRFHGVLWAVYDPVHPSVEEEMRFITTLAAYAALAASNVRLFRTAEVGRQRLAAIIASSPDPVLVTDQEDRLILANPAARQALGLPSGPSDGQPTERVRVSGSHVIGQKDLRDLLDALGSETDSTSRANRSVEVVLSDGKIYYAAASLVVASDKPVGRVCVLRDVTRFKELDALKSEFISTVSHDLRSPLTLMRGYATMLEMVGDLNEQQQNYTTKIISGVDSMSRLVNTLLDLGRIDAGVGLIVEQVVLQEIITTVMESVRLQAEAKEIRLDLDLAPDLPLSLEADRVLLQQALYNLVENALKYTPSGGSVALRLRAYPSVLQFQVQDSGIGIAPADQPRLFEKFFRGSQREARAQRGSGLGLAIVRSIAERHGGKVWVESTLGKGSTFFLLIPLAHAQPE